jgi:hypothetical protein
MSILIIGFVSFIIGWCSGYITGRDLEEVK